MSVEVMSATHSPLMCRIEPEWYCPIMPMVLVNGCDGIGTGYSTFVPNYNPREIVNNLRRLMHGLEPMEIVRHQCTLHMHTMPMLIVLLI